MEKNHLKKNQKQESKDIISKKSKSLPIDKLDILSMEKVYSKYYNSPYLYKIYILNEDFKRVNLFFENIDGSVYEFKNLFSFLIDYCDRYDNSLRIIYDSADFEKLNDFLKINKLNLPKNTVFLNLKPENYLEVGVNEKYVATSWISAKRLINTYNLNSSVYFYLGYLDECTFEEYFQISSICYNDNVIILNDNLNKLNGLKRFNYLYDFNITKIVEDNSKILCCDFGDMFVEGIELLNYMFFNKFIDINKWEIYVISKKVIPNLNVNITFISEKLDEYDLFLKFSHGKTIKNNDENFIELIANETVNDEYNVLNILIDDELENFNIDVPLKIKKNDYIRVIEEIFIKINEVG